MKAILYHDLLGIQCLSGESCLLHPFHRPDFDCRTLEILYTPVDHGFATYDSRKPFRTVIDLNPLFRAWLGAVRNHPREYLVHRLHVLGVLLSANDRPTSFYFREIVPNSLGFKMAASESGRLLESYVKHAPSVFFTGYFYVLVLAYELVYLSVLWTVNKSLFKFTPAQRAICFLTFSALLYFIPYFVLTPSMDFRYLYWVTLSAGLALVLMVYSLLFPEPFQAH